MLIRFEDRRGVGLYSLAEDFSNSRDRWGNRRPMSRRRRREFDHIWYTLCLLQAGVVPEWLPGHEAQHVRFWFTARAGMYIRAAMRFRKLARGYGVRVRVRFTRRPGKIVYADEWQVASVGVAGATAFQRQRSDTRWETWNGDRASLRNAKGRQQMRRFVKAMGSVPIVGFDTPFFARRRRGRERGQR